MKGFTQNETELLLTEVIDSTKTGKSLSSVFQDVANLTGRAKGSVRNYYYNVLKNEDKKNELNKTIDGVNGLVAVRAKAFSKEDEASLISAVEKGKSQGKSVRRVIMDLANGDDKLYLRYQNKYRNYLSKKNRIKFDDKNFRAEEFKYFDRLSKEIDGLVEKIKKKYAEECSKLKKENEDLSKELSFFKRQAFKKDAQSYFLLNDATPKN